MRQRSERVDFVWSKVMCGDFTDENDITYGVKDLRGAIPILKENCLGPYSGRYCQIETIACPAPESVDKASNRIPTNAAR